jgi:hypothetical protein
MARRSSKVGGLATVGVGVVILSPLLWISDERRLATFVALGRPAASPTGLRTYLEDATYFARRLLA